MKPISILRKMLLKNSFLLVTIITGLIYSQSSSAQVTCATCALGYPDNSNLPRSAVVFNESEVLAAWEPAPGNCLAPTQIKLWYTDEHALTLGVRRVIVKTSGGTTTTDYPITPTPATVACVTNPLVGTTIATGDQSGNDVADGGGRPLWPALFITDLTVNGASSRAGDWQQGGTGIPPTRVCGTWKAAVRTVDKTKNPAQVTVTPDSDPAKNHWDLDGGDAPPAGTDDGGYGAEVVWDLGALNLIPGHTYRLQFMVHDGDQNKDGGDVGEACTTLIAPMAPIYNPDFNSTFVNVPVPGNVNTNDKVPSGTTYGTSPTLVSSPAGSSPVLTMNSNGTYSFVANVPGVYTYNVPVCVPGQAAPCPVSALVITVLNSVVNTNPPVANVDIATTRVNTAVTLKSLANDAPGNPNTMLVPSSVTVIVSPLHGTATVNPFNGDISYLPAGNYTGPDTLTYQVCDNQSPPKCASAKQIITVIPVGATNTTVAADDYKITQINTPATGNVKTNDSDPEGDFQTVTTQNTTIAGKGTLVLAADGSYTFTPVTGYTGPIDFPYTTCDNGTPQACASATLHVLVRPEFPVINPDFNSTFVNVPVPGNVSTNDKVPSGTMYGTPTLISSPAGSSPSITLNTFGIYSFVSNLPGVYTYNVPVCVPGQAAPCPPSALVITVLNAVINTNPPVANVDIATTKVNTPVTLKSLANDAAGNAGTLLVPSSVTVIVAPLHGTTSVNTANGDITYTPAAGFTGPDTLTYQVCDNQIPAKCASAKQIITVIPNGVPNTTVAADDYKITQINTAATGNVKTNDSDPEGDVQTVTTQNTTLTGKGTLVLAADGSYTFTPATGYTGPIDFPYTTCDNGTPQACASATLHILVEPSVPSPNLTPTIEFIPNISHGIANLSVVTSVYELKNNPTSGVIEVFVTRDPKYTITFPAAATNIGGRAVNNGVWTLDNSNPLFYIFRTSSVIPGNGVSSFGFSVTFNPNSSNGQTPISAFISTNSGGETSADAGDNHDDDILIYFLN